MLALCRARVPMAQGEARALGNSSASEAGRVEDGGAHPEQRTQWGKC